MKKVIINENEKGLVFTNGKFTRCISAGSNILYYGETVEKLPIGEPIVSCCISTEMLMQFSSMESICDIITVADNEYALWYVNGIYKRILGPGYYAFFKTKCENRFEKVCLDDPKISESIPKMTLLRIPPTYYQRYEVKEYEKGLLTYNNQFKELLEPGVYYFWRQSDINVNIQCIDLRVRRLEISGQEILTADKVTLRLNCSLNYKVVDCVRIITEIEDYQQQIYTTVQLAIREYIGKYRLDEILESKEEMGSYIFNRLKEKEESLYISVEDFGIKDIILPGEIRDIMNTVLVAEKQAQANVITRREEVASTRSLLNTARLMEENPTLYRLKELEYVEKICGNVGSITLNGSGDVLSQLLNLTSAKKN